MSHATARPQARRVGRRSRTRSRAAVLAAAVVAGTLLTPVPSAFALTLTETRTEVLRLTNLHRAAAGCRPVKLNTSLTSAAQAHANNMSVKKYFSHTSKDGTTWAARVRQHGYSKPGGENIAWGYTTPAAVMKAWMNSYGHKKNILNCAFTTIGVGWAPSGNYWVQDFGYPL